MTTNTPVNKKPPQRVRVCVLKADCKSKPPRAKTDYTCVYVPQERFDELLAIADNNRRAVTGALRLASERAVLAPGRTWSGTCLAGAQRILTQARAIRAAGRKL